MVVKQATFVAAVVATLTVSVPVVTPTIASARPTSKKCANIVVLALRGTGDQKAPYLGRTAALVNKVQRGFKQTVRIRPLGPSEYPASLNYPSSLGKGESALRADLKNLAANCHKAKLLLVGYSQGAHVIGDALDNRGPQVSKAVNARIKAIVLFGDPSFRANEGYDHGTFDRRRSGVFARPAGSLKAYASRIVSICNSKDRFCQNNNPIFGNAEGNRAHSDYPGRYLSYTYDFVRHKLK